MEWADTTSYSRDDQVFELVGQAIEAAQKMSIEGGDTVFAIWELMDHDAPYTAYLCYQGELFKSAY